MLVLILTITAGTFPLPFSPHICTVFCYTSDERDAVIQRWMWMLNTMRRRKSYKWLCGLLETLH